ncbi:MAG: class I SAM-dependent methyltransferase [Acidimicrobiales bacterium]
MRFGHPGLCAESAWGSHQEFAQLYGSYLDAVYRSSSSPVTGSGRWRLIHSIAAALRSRGVRRVLDCAAGTGFPALDLALDSDSLPGLEIHCTDADPEMLNILGARAKLNDFDLGCLAPPFGPDLGRGAVASMRVDWADLHQIQQTYDYVMCRGNSLAYANTWSGGRDVTSVDLIAGYVEQIAKKVRPGGYLHVDAPWRLVLPQQAHGPVVSGAATIWEQVTTVADARLWRVDFKLPTGQLLKFERFSTLLTIYDVQAMLDDLGFTDTEPFQLQAERPGFGVIIARRPQGRAW